MPSESVKCSVYIRIALEQAIMYNGHGKRCQQPDRSADMKAEPRTKKCPRNFDDRYQRRQSMHEDEEEKKMEKVGRKGERASGHSVFTVSQPREGKNEGSCRASRVGR